MAVRFYDEMLNWHGERSPHAAELAPAALVQQGEVRGHYGRFAEWLGAQSATTLQNKRAEADLIFRRVGITFEQRHRAHDSVRHHPAHLPGQ